MGGGGGGGGTINYLDDFCLLFIIYINHFTFDVILEHPAGHVVKF